MADTPSAAVGFSPKLPSPTELSIMEEGKTRHSRASVISVIISPSNFHQIIAELMGTYILIFAGCGAALFDKVQKLTIVGIATVWGLVLMVMIYTLGHVSGAHFNPAVTIAFAAAQKFPWKHLLGSTLACLTLRVLFNDQDDIRATVTQYSAPTSDLEAITWEYIVSFILMFTICGVTTDHRAIKQLSGVAVGATVLFNVIISGPITGASMNPARSIGPAVVSAVYKNLWVYVVAPIVGATAATLIYSLLRVRKPDKSEESTKSIYNHLYVHADA